MESMDVVSVDYVGLFRGKGGGGWPGNKNPAIKMFLHVKRVFLDFRPIFSPIFKFDSKRLRIL